MASGIYKISNIINNKCYIGSAVNISSRWRSHKRTLDIKKHHNIFLQKECNQYGIDNFKFEIIAKCPKEYLIKLEQWFIDNLNPEYNICKIAGSILGHKFSEEIKKRASESRKIALANGTIKVTVTGNKCILMIDLNTKEIVKEFSSVREAVYFLGKTKSSCSSIIKVCKRKPSCFSVFVYSWSYKDSYNKNEIIYTKEEIANNLKQKRLVTLKTSELWKTFGERHSATMKKLHNQGVKFSRN